MIEYYDDKTYQAYLIMNISDRELLMKLENITKYQDIKDLINFYYNRYDEYDRLKDFISVSESYKYTEDVNKEMKARIQAMDGINLDSLY
jgi:hypothetical protein